MHTLIIDDEKPAINLLSGFVQRLPFLQLSLATTNAFEGLDILERQNIDLLLLDIEMPDISGIDLVKSLKKPPMVIFTTAYEQYAIQGFELDVVDYLVKPIRFERFLKGVNKARKLFLNHRAGDSPPKDQFLFVKANYQTIRIDFDDILYIEGLKDYVKIYTGKKMVVTRLNLKGIAEKLPEDQFIRIHRSFIVSLSKIAAFQKGNISLGDRQLPVGDTYREALMRRLG
ncbi:MAG: LytTR family DNA-binding domain-containing protein [Bacteroidota bacterium]